jgi:hypothetical protein
LDRSFFCVSVYFQGSFYLNPFFSAASVADFLHLFAGNTFFDTRFGADQISSPAFNGATPSDAGHAFSQFRLH